MGRPQAEQPAAEQPAVDAEQQPAEQQLARPAGQTASQAPFDHPRPAPELPLAAAGLPLAAAGLPLAPDMREFQLGAAAPPRCTGEGDMGTPGPRLGLWPEPWPASGPATGEPETRERAMEGTAGGSAHTCAAARRTGGLGGAP